MAENLKVGDKVQYIGAVFSRDREYVKARTGKIISIKDEMAEIKALDGTVFTADLKSLVKV